MVLFSGGLKIEDGCQSWMLIVTTYIVLLITFHNKQFLIIVWAFMANNNVNNEALGGTWLPGPFLKCQLRSVECFGYMAVEMVKHIAWYWYHKQFLLTNILAHLVTWGFCWKYHLFLTNLIVFSSCEKIYLGVNISQLSYRNCHLGLSPSFIANIVKIALEGLCKIHYIVNIINCHNSKTHTRVRNCLFWHIKAAVITVSK